MSWFADPIPPRGEPCDQATPPRIDRELTVRLLRGPGVAPELLLEQTRRLQGFYQPYGLRFRAAGPPEQIPEGVLFTAVKPSSVEVLLAPLVDFTARHATPARPGQVIVALLPALIAEGSAAGRYFSELDGLTLSPALVAERPSLAPLTALGPFTPLILLSQQDLLHHHPAHLDLTLAHELGHALGLSHIKHRGNLMNPGPQRCVPSLDAGQVAALKFQ